MSNGRLRDSEGWKIFITVCEILAIVAFILGIYFLFQSPVIAEDERYVMCMDRVNIRLGASSKSDSIGWLEPGDVVYPDGQKKGGYIHCEIPQIEAGEGWIHKGYLVEDKPEKVNTKGVITGNAKVQVRKNVNGKRTRWAKPGGEVRVYYWSDQWCLTNVGYIKSQFVELDGE